MKIIVNLAVSFPVITCTLLLLLIGSSMLVFFSGEFGFLGSVQYFIALLLMAFALKIIVIVMLGSMEIKLFDLPKVPVFTSLFFAISLFAASGVFAFPLLIRMP